MFVVIKGLGAEYEVLEVDGVICIPLEKNPPDGLTKRVRRDAVLQLMKYGHVDINH